MRWAFAIAISAGYYSPQPHAGAPCPDNVCPTGLFCSPATMTCETAAVDARLADTPGLLTDTPMIDARLLDAAVPNVPMLRQQGVNAADASGTLAVTLPSLPLNGNLLVMVGATVSGSLSSVSGGGAIWSLATKSIINGNVEIWYGFSDGSDATITISRGGSNAPIWLAVTEWSGITKVSTLDAASSDHGLSNTADPGPITTTGPTLLILGTSDDAGNTFGTPSQGPWTPLTGTLNIQWMQSEWYRVEPASGTYEPTTTETANDWESGIAAFRYTP